MFRMFRTLRNAIMTNTPDIAILHWVTETGSPHWLPGIVKTVLGPVSYQIKLKDGRLWKRHLDQLLPDQSHRTDDKQVDEDVIDCTIRTYSYSRGSTCQAFNQSSTTSRQTDIASSSVFVFLSFFKVLHYYVYS